MKIELPEQLVIARAAQLREDWLAALDAGGEDAVEVNAGAVAKIDGTGIALLGALVRETENRQRAFQWAAKNDVIFAAATDMGMAQHLHLSDN